MSSNVPTEFGNYLNQIRSRKYLIGALFAFSFSLFWAFFRRISPSLIRVISLPGDIRYYRSRIIKVPYCTKDIFTHQKILPCSIQLAVGKIEFEHHLQWHLDFNDPEITTSLHRWGWLLRGITDADERITLEQGLGLIRSWLANCLEDEDLGSDPYSASERILNSSIFLLKQGCKNIPEDILSSYRVMIYQIAKNLEYYEGDRTGNHAFNNGRGLFIGGLLTNTPKAIDLACSIFRDRIPKLITEDGFLRESSSHYHFLFTRWILEIYWYAEKYSQNKITEFIAPYASQLVERCWFFLIHDPSNDSWSIPLIGDISPDFPPNWLMSLPWSTPALAVFRPDNLPAFNGVNGWASMFSLEGKGSSLPICHSSTFPGSYWHRIEFEGAVLFVHAEATDGRVHADHRHLDLGGFALYRNGALVFADCGRVDYTQSAQSRYGKGPKSHNTIFVDGLPPATDSITYFSRQYKSSSVKTKLRESRSAVFFSLSHSGFKRIYNDDIHHERKFILTQSSFAIRDKIEGAKCHQIMLRFHVAPGLKLNEVKLNNWQLTPLGASFIGDERLKETMLNSVKDGFSRDMCSLEYGSIEECSTIELEAQMTLPITLINKLVWD